MIPGLLKEKSSVVLCADSQKLFWVLMFYGGHGLTQYLQTPTLSSAILQVGGVMKRGVMIVHALFPTEMPTLTPCCSHTVYAQT